LIMKRYIVGVGITTTQKNMTMYLPTMEYSDKALI
jgi:hypothetical protein